MPFSDDVKVQAFARAGGRCECTRSLHSHNSRCTRILTLSNAEFRHIANQSPDRHDALSNCELLCHGCHAKTVYFGAP
jgi:hypothetical protein